MPRNSWKKILISRNTFTLRKLTHLKAKFRFFLPLPRNPRFPAMEAWVEFEFELLTVESLSLSSSSNFACFPPRSCSASDPVASHSIWGSCGRDSSTSPLIFLLRTSAFPVTQNRPSLPRNFSMENHRSPTQSVFWVYSKCIGLFFCSNISLNICTGSLLNKRCITLPAVYCPPFASEVIFWAIKNPYSSPLYPLTVGFKRICSTIRWHSRLIVISELKILQNLLTPLLRCRVTIYRGKVIQHLFSIRWDHLC